MAARMDASAAHHIFGRAEKIMASMFEELFVLIRANASGSSMGVWDAEWWKA